MTGALIKKTLDFWASSLREVKARMHGFIQERVAASAGLFLDGLPGDERRKTGWTRTSSEHYYKVERAKGTRRCRKWLVAEV